MHASTQQIVRSIYAPYGGRIQNVALVKAYETIGGIDALADALDIKPETIYGWRAGRSNIPVPRAMQIQILTGVPVQQLVPSFDWDALFKLAQQAMSEAEDI